MCWRLPGFPGGRACITAWARMGVPSFSAEASGDGGMEWNPEEKTWDCPCHGSGFDGDGKLIDNPAQTGIGEK